MTAAATADLYCHDRLAPLVSSLDAVGDAELALFHRQGYLAIRQGFDAVTINDALLAVTDLIDGANPAFRGISFETGSGPSDTFTTTERRQRVRKLMGFVDHDERLRALSIDAALLRVVSLFMQGATPELFQDMALLKPPGGREKPWHQDMAYFNVPIDATVVGVFYWRRQATPANGAMHILPGSHHQGPQLHFSRRDWQICDTEAPRGSDVVVPLPPGGVLLWHGLTLHSSPDNETPHSRRALQFHYRPAAVSAISTEERMRHYGGEVRGAEC